jgi:outer membrane lipoprotein SlyB
VTLKEIKMNATFEQVKTPVANSKPLWAAVSVLGVAVVAMGAALVHVQSRPTVDADKPVQAITAPAVATASPAPVPAKPEVPLLPQTAVQKAIKQGSQPVRVLQAPARAVPAPVAVAGTQSAGYPAAYPQEVGQRVSDQTATPICATCGKVESVTTVQREAKPGGVGVVAGGVLGAIVGNQVGKGSGRALATIAGAVGGGWAGNTIEKNMNKTTAYQVHVRMEDGSLRTVEQVAPAAVGSRVTVDGGVLRPADDGVAAPAAPRPTAVPVYTRG